LVVTDRGAESGRERPARVPGSAGGGYDAVHLAAADRVRDLDLVVAAGDGMLLEAAATQGMATALVG
jgi:diacylglycerol kinase family enzyme